MKRTLTALLLAAALLLSLTACGSAPAAPSSSAGTVPFTDDLGRTVDIPAEITRIVPTGPLAQHVLFAIAPDLMVALTAGWDSRPEDFINPQYLSLPYLGQLYGSAELNVEQLALADPQLILDIGEPKASSAEDLDDLTARTSVPSLFLSSDLASMGETYRTLGRLLGREERGEELASFCERVYSRALSVMEQVGDQRERVLFVLGGEGLNVLAAGSYHAELLDLLCHNLAVVENPSSKGMGNAVTMEQISLWDPDFVIFAPGSIYSSVQEREPWNRVSAIVSGRYVEVPNAPLNWTGMPPSVQRYLGLIWLPAVLYPEYCQYDVKAEITECYRLLFGCELTEEQYTSLTANAFPGR